MISRLATAAAHAGVPARERHTTWAVSLGTPNAYMQRRLPSLSPYASHAFGMRILIRARPPCGPGADAPGPAYSSVAACIHTATPPGTRQPCFRGADAPGPASFSAAACVDTAIRPRTRYTAGRAASLHSGIQKRAATSRRRSSPNSSLVDARKLASAHTPGITYAYILARTRITPAPFADAPSLSLAEHSVPEGRNARLTPSAMPYNRLPADSSLLTEAPTQAHEEAALLDAMSDFAHPDSSQTSSALLPRGAQDNAASFHTAAGLLNRRRRQKHLLHPSIPLRNPLGTAAGGRASFSTSALPVFGKAAGHARPLQCCARQQRREHKHVTCQLDTLSRRQWRYRQKEQEEIHNCKLTASACGISTCGWRERKQAHPRQRADVYARAVEDPGPRRYKFEPCSPKEAIIASCGISTCRWRERKQALPRQCVDVYAPTAEDSGPRRYKFEPCSPREAIIASYISRSSATAAGLSYNNSRRSCSGRSCTWRSSCCSVPTSGRQVNAGGSPTLVPLRTLKSCPPGRLPSRHYHLYYWGCNFSHNSSCEGNVDGPERGIPAPGAVVDSTPAATQQQKSRASAASADDVPSAVAFGTSKEQLLSPSGTDSVPGPAVGDALELEKSSGPLQPYVDKTTFLKERYGPPRDPSTLLIEPHRLTGEERFFQNLFIALPGVAFLMMLATPVALVRYHVRKLQERIARTEDVAEELAGDLWEPVFQECDFSKLRSVVEQPTHTFVFYFHPDSISSQVARPLLRDIASLFEKLRVRVMVAAVDLAEKSIPDALRRMFPVALAPHGELLLPFAFQGQQPALQLYDGEWEAQSIVKAVAREVPAAATAVDAAQELNAWSEKLSECLFSLRFVDERPGSDTIVQQQNREAVDSDNQKNGDAAANAADRFVEERARSVGLARGGLREALKECEAARTELRAMVHKQRKQQQLS